MIEIKEIRGKLSDKIDRIIARLNVMPSKLKRSVGMELEAIGRDLVKTTREIIINEPLLKTGRIYNITLGTFKIKHRASASGESPAIITGKLAASVQYKMSGWKILTFGSDVYYARFLEYADLLSQTGQWSSKIAPRPFISAAYHREESRISGRIHGAMVRGIS